MTDSRDAELAAAGDYEAFERLYRKYFSRIYSLCARLSGSRQKATELMEDVFVRAWTELPQLNGETAFATWLHRLATDVALSAGNVERDDPDPTPRDSKEFDLQEAIDRLPADARQIIVLHDVEGYKHEQLAEIFGISTGVSKAKLRRARVLLKEVLGR
jgi:RNA polymerase sigma factor (sigma-70 family)